jgi:hypothetical protein
MVIKFLQFSFYIAEKFDFDDIDFNPIALLIDSLNCDLSNTKLKNEIIKLFDIVPGEF